jgi:hypothetical protein
VVGSQVHEHQEDTRPLEVAQEPVTEAPALARPLDQARHVGHHELLLAGGDHAEMGFEGGEGIVGDLGLGRRDPRDQGALAGVREADQGHVGHQLQFQLQPALLAALGLFGERWCSPAVAEEAGVTPAAPASRRRQPGVAGAHQVGDDLTVATLDDGALGDGDPQVGPRAPVTGLALAVAAVARPSVGMVVERPQGSHAGIGDQPHVAALAPVTAVGSASRDVGLPPERHSAGPAVTPPGAELRLVDEPGRQGTMSTSLRPLR